MAELKGTEGATIGGVTIEAIPAWSLTEQEYTMLAAEHLKKAIQYDVLAAQLRDPRTEVNLEAGIYRHCGVQPGDTWVERVERLNAIIDGLVVGTVVV